MRAPNFTYVASVAALVSLLFIQSVQAAPQRLVLLLFDGARWDYLDFEGLGDNGFRKLVREGVRAEYLQPDFPTTSYPNYYSLMTGLHCENHGMVANYMHDPVRKESFYIGTNPEQYHAHWWDDGDPLWITAVRQKKQSYMYFWLGCEVEIRGLRPTNCTKYPGRVPTYSETRDAINKTVDVLQENKADVVGIYLESLDKMGHVSGPLSGDIKAILKEYDNQVANLLHQLESRGLDDVNVMIFSDHGMASVSPSRVVDISTALRRSDLDLHLRGGSLTYIWPRQGRIDAVYNSIANVSTHMKVYKKADIPERWYYKKARLTAPVIAVAETGWMILTPGMPKFPAEQLSMQAARGAHGFDNASPDMRGIFAAWGPAFRKGHVTGPLHVVDMYQVMCHVLEITPSPNNGSWDKVEDMMSRTDTSSAATFRNNLLYLTVFSTMLALQ